MFDELNLMVLKNPELMELLRILFYVKVWALTLLAFYFLYLVYFCNDQKKSRHETREKAVYRFLA